MTRYTQGDIVTLTAFVELPVHGGAQVIVKAPNEAEDRTQIHKDAILSVEKGRLKAGDKMSKTVQRNKLRVTLTGVVEHRTKKNFTMGRTSIFGSCRR
jgi:hypothetical protein